MSELQERIIRGIKAIVKAKSKGLDTTDWETHLYKLIKELKVEKKTLVKMGKFGFCTCLLTNGLCSGCWKTKNACTCKELEVNPEEVINRQYASLVRSAGIH